MAIDLNWLVGSHLDKVEKIDYSWFFTFSGDGSIATQSPWRLITNEGIYATSEDHGHLFGLKVPVDATIRVLATTKERKVLAYKVAEQSSDLIVMFENGVRLEFLNLSCGYEAWSTYHQSVRMICMGGGQLAQFKVQK